MAMENGNVLDKVCIFVEHHFKSTHIVAMTFSWSSFTPTRSEEEKDPGQQCKQRKDGIESKSDLGHPGTGQ